MFNAALPVGESAELYAFGGYSDREAVADGLYRKADWVPRTVSYVYPDGFFPLEESDLTDKSAVAGLRGDMGDWSGDLGFGYGEGRFAFGAANSINPSYAAEYLARNPGADGASIAATRGTGRCLQRRTERAAVDAQRRCHTGRSMLARLPRSWLSEAPSGGTRTGWSRETAPRGPADPATPRAAFPRAHHLNDGSVIASCGIQGYPGYSPTSASLSERNRSSFGAYADMELRPSDGTVLSGALRFENYSDAGNSLTGKVAGRVGLGASGAALRAAASTGFRAPRLPQRGFNTIGFVGGGGGLQSAGFLPEGDPVACAEFGACSLSHETSFSLTGGFVYSSDSGFLFTADYYRVAVADAIALTQILNQSHGLRAGAQFQGRPVDAVAFWTNAIDTRTQGLDVVASWRFRGMGMGRGRISRRACTRTARRSPPTGTRTSSARPRGS